MKALVSIITPCYNGEKYIDNYIDNILRQTYEAVEVILINDGSTDKSEELILKNSYKIEDKNYTFLYYAQENSGVSAAINCALELVSGEYIMLLDMDDVLYPEAIKMKADFLSEHLDYGMVRNNGYYTFEKYPKRKWKFERTGKRWNKEKIFEDLLLVRTNNWPGTYMVRSESLFSIYPERKIYVSRYGQNLQFMIPVAYFFKTGYIDECLMEYYIHNDSLSHNSDMGKTIEMVNGYENNRKEIVNQMNISKYEKVRYHKKIEQKYLNDRLGYSIRINNRELFNKQYQLMKQNNWLKLSDKCFFLLMKIKGFPFVYRIYSHYVFIIKKTVI